MSLIPKGNGEEASKSVLSPQLAKTQEQKVDEKTAPPKEGAVLATGAAESKEEKFAAMQNRIPNDVVQRPPNSPIVDLLKVFSFFLALYILYRLVAAGETDSL